MTMVSLALNSLASSTRSGLPLVGWDLKSYTTHVCMQKHLKKREVMDLKAIWEEHMEGLERGNGRGKCYD